MGLIYFIDIGNTRTHCAVVESRTCAVSASADYSSAEFASIFSGGRLFERSGAEAVSWCSVVPAYSAALEPLLAGVKSMQLTVANSPIPILIDAPSQLGQDRIADAVGAGFYFEPPYVVVDMGTAVTIDLVDSSGAYAGGAIAPGMNAFVSYLSERAAQLPLINPAEADCSLTIGKNTRQAMYVGCAKGFCKLVDGILADIERDYFGGRSAAPKTVFTGGSVAYLPKQWLGGRKVDLHLSHIGLAKSYEFNRKNL